MIQLLRAVILPGFHSDSDFESDLLLTFGICFIFTGIWRIYEPAALIFVGIVLTGIAYLTAPKEPQGPQDLNGDT